MALTDSGTAAFGKYHFLIRRLHSLSGIVPVGVFLIVHLFTNSTILVPGEPGAEFQKAVERIHALGPLLIPVEIVGIFIPLAFHLVVGVMIVLTGKSNTGQYKYADNWRYTLQRTSGVIAVFFIGWHLYQLHWLGKPFGGGAFELHGADGSPTGAATTAATLQAAWYIAPLYAIGIIASVFHFANGIWTSLITWGITIRPKSQRIAGYACAAFGIVLGAVGLGALSGFRTFKVDGPAVPAVQTDAQAMKTSAAAGADHETN